MRFSNRVAVITGGGNGMGAATARRFAQEGAHVVVGDIEGDSAARVAEEIHAGGGARWRCHSTSRSARRSRK
jgi:3-oxoacyl-[acyl-carrier protein] reductase